MVRSIPLRISRPATPARRPRISRTCWRVGSDIDGHLYLAVDDACLVHGDGLGGGQGMGLTVDQREGAAVLPALELALLAEHLSLGKRDVLRSEERRVGKECVSTCRSRLSEHQ